MYVCIYSDPAFNTALCSAANCGVACTVENGVAKCFCKTGYKLNSDNKTCSGIVVQLFNH